MQTACILLMAAYVAIFRETSGAPVLDLCAGCTVLNGAGYNSHPTDCDKFVQCHLDQTGVLMAEIQQCAFATYWSMSKLACLPASEVDCPTESCTRIPTGVAYDAEGNCRGYWQCRDGHSVAKCCPYGQKFDPKYGCVNNTNNECLEHCFDEVYAKPLCDKSSVPDHPEMYQQFVEGWGMLQLYCAPGTDFLQEECSCAKVDLLNIGHDTCKPELHLPFTKDHLDYSGNNLYVGNENVHVANGVAKFNGINSRLIIPRFTNLEHSTTVIMKIKYTSNHMTSGGARAIVSNSDCLNKPSILVSEDASHVYFGVGTSEKEFAYTYIPQQPVNSTNTPSAKDVLYEFNNAQLAGSNGVNSVAMPAEGFLRNVQCALQIGHAELMAPFKGEIDEITVYLCEPPHGDKKPVDTLPRAPRVNPLPKSMTTTPLPKTTTTTPVPTTTATTTSVPTTTTTTPVPTTTTTPVPTTTTTPVSTTTTTTTTPVPTTTTPVPTTTTTPVPTTTTTTTTPVPTTTTTTPVPTTTTTTPVPTTTTTTPVPTTTTTPVPTTTTTPVPTTTTPVPKTTTTTPVPTTTTTTPKPSPTTVKPSTTVDPLEFLDMQHLIINLH